MHAYLGGTTGERITDLILENKTSQARLAKALHISEATMSRYISGASEIPGSTLMAIAAHFGVTTDFLLGATDIPFRTNYDLDRLGLSKEAAEKMLAGELDMHVLNTLLANEDFAILTHQIAADVKDTNSECLAVMNKVMEIAGGVVQKHAKTQSLDKETLSGLTGRSARTWSIPNCRIPRRWNPAGPGSFHISGKALKTGPGGAQN